MGFRHHDKMTFSPSTLVADGWNGEGAVNAA